MKILLSAYACRPNHGTEPGNGWHWASTMAKHHEVWCLTGRRNQAHVDEQLRLESIPNLHFVYVAVHPLWERLISIDFNKFVYLHYLFWQKAALNYADKLQDELDFDIVHHVTYGSIHMGSRLCRLPKPFIFGPIGGGQSAPRQLKRYFQKSLIRENLRSWFALLLMKLYRSKETLSQAQLVLTTNQETYDLAEKYGATHIRMELDSALPHSFFPKEMPIRANTDQLKVLWIGSMISRKGVEILVDVWEDLPDNIILTLVGSGPEEEHIKNKIHALGLQEKIVCVGKVPYDKVKEFYLSHDVFVFSSIRDSFGSQLLEAMAYGLPIVAMNHQGARTFVPENASIKVDVAEPEDIILGFRAALVRLLGNPEERNSLGRNGYEFAIENQWDTKINRTVSDYYASVQMATNLER